MSCTTCTARRGRRALSPHPCGACALCPWSSGSPRAAQPSKDLGSPLWGLGDVGPCPQGQEHGFYGPAVEAWGKVGLTSPPAAARLLRTRCGGFGRTWGHVHRDKNLVSSGSAVEDLKGCGAADTGTGTQFPQAPLWRLGGTWAHVHRDRNPVSSGPAVKTSRGRGIASTGTRTRSPQDPPQEEQIQACFREETLTNSEAWELHSIRTWIHEMLVSGPSRRMSWDARSESCWNQRPSLCKSESTSIRLHPL
ncbi:uncharacterized protein LOC123386798 [Felis catus]|uniref:uncharacterized protein LOC123386798 n=1 Tax=Felis catus TaxID=9685 RepID=UPI001D19ACB2|nr:uncharacterized protein LOC123386798 [Felis catus]